MQRVENADVCLSCGIEDLTHVRNALVCFGNTLQPIPYLAALGNEIVVWINNNKTGEVLLVRHVVMFA